MKNRLTVQIRRLQMASVVVFVLLAAATAVFMSGQKFQLTEGFLTRDELQSQSETVFASASRVFYNLDLRFVVVGVLLIGCILPLLNLTKWKSKYSKYLKEKRMPWRWLDFGIMAAWMVFIVALLSGVQDIATLKVLSGVMLVTVGLGWVAEQQNLGAKKPVWSAFLVSLLSGALPWLLIGWYAVDTLIYGMVRSPWYVYALYGVTLISFLLIGFNKWQQLKAKKQWKQYEFAERNYLLLGILARTAFVVILIIGLS